MFSRIARQDTRESVGETNPMKAAPGERIRWGLVVDKKDRERKKVTENSPLTKDERERDRGWNADGKGYVGEVTPYLPVYTWEDSGALAE